MAKYSKLIASIRIAELSGLANRMVDYYDTVDLTTYTDYSPFVDDFKALAEDLSVAWNADKLESELAGLDATRDEAFRAIYYLLQGYMHSPDSTTKTLGDYLYKIFDKYGMETVSMSYDGESGNIDSFLSDITDPSIGASVLELPDLTAALGNLQTAQEEFVAKQNEYNNKRSIRKETNTAASAIKPDLLEVLNGKIVNYHNVLAETKDAAFIEMAGTIDDMIVEENELTRARKNTNTTK